MVSDDAPAAGPAAAPRAALDLSKYTLTAPLQIAQHLAGIAKSGYMVTVFANKGKVFVLTQLLAVDSKEKTFVFDWGPEDEVNHELLKSERNVFVCSPEGVKTQFVTGQPRQVTFDGKPAFEVDLPEQLIKLQRREFFRIHTPVVATVLCRIADYPNQEIDLALFDISVGGVGLWLPDVSTPGFDLGQKYYQCTVEIKPFGVINLGIEVRHRLASRLPNGKDVIRLGCGYLGLTPAMETLIQRYVGFLERERRALLG